MRLLQLMHLRKKINQEVTTYVKIDHYFQMDVGDVIEYTLEKATEIPWDRDSMEAVVPPSHGNLNYVYRVWDGKGHSIYIKQAGSEAGYPRI